MKIVVDAMGTDTHPAPDVEGAVLAARERSTSVILVGAEQHIRSELAKHRTTGLPIDIVNAEDAITMEDKPAVVGKSKPNSSMHIGMQLVRDGQADAFVTMGNTGAVQAVAMLFTLKRIKGVKRPALSAIFRIKDRPIIFLDIGANADSRQEWLEQFAIMGSVYAQNALGLEHPVVGLLSNGEEEGKGTNVIREANELIAQRSMINFFGNVEPKEILDGQVDVVVSDGFTGNILAKTFEASTRYLARMIRDEIQSNPISMVGGVLIRPAMKRVRRKIDTFEVGGAPLLGVNGVVIIGHGSSNSFAVKNAIHQATMAVDGRIVDVIGEKLADLPASSPVTNSVNE
jgi:glycerol-3-phosphate acyltransferase PlsX